MMAEPLRNAPQRYSIIFIALPLSLDNTTYATSLLDNCKEFHMN